MKPRFPATRFYFVAMLAVVIAGCATRPTLGPDSNAVPRPVAQSVLRSAPLEPALEDRILALDPEHVTDGDVRDTLARGPTPRIILIHGGIYPVYLSMASFGRFLTRMGYPEDRIRDPGDKSWSVGPYGSSADVAGEVAWAYEHDGVRPMIVGHSQGGIQAVKVLHELNGSFGSELHVYDPVSGTAEPRTTIVDPLTGSEREIVGVSVAYAGVIGTGGWALVLPNHWIVAGRLMTVPDTVDEFSGYRIGFDLFAWDGPGLEGLKEFHANGKAIVHNVTLPADYAHVVAPVTAGSASTPELRAWVDAYDPDDTAGRAPIPEGDVEHILFAADVWHYIKRHWVLEAQRFVRARQALPPG